MAPVSFRRSNPTYEQGRIASGLRTSEAAAKDLVIGTYLNCFAGDSEIQALMLQTFFNNRMEDR